MRKAEARPIQPLLPARKLRRLATRIIAVERKARTGQRITAPQAAMLLAAAQEAAVAGRQAMAHATRPGDHAILVDTTWKVFWDTLDAHRKHLLRYPGVIGFGLGHRWRHGMRTQERCITVMVERKEKRAILKRRQRRILPKALRAPNGSAIPLDVVEMGRLRRTVVTSAGDSVGPFGRRRMATLGSFALDQSGRTLALTAMHLFFGIPTSAQGEPLEVTSPSSIADPAAPVLGEFVDGTMKGIDAATVSVDAPEQASWTAGAIPIRGWRGLALPADDSLSVQMVGATSGYRRGVLEQFGVQFPSWNIDSAILAHIDSQEGDSGAALLDNDGYVLGLLVGRPDQSDTLRVFCAIGPVLDQLGCDIPTR